MKKPLTLRQTQVRDFLLLGLSMADIARKLDLTPERIRQIRAVVNRKINEPIVDEPRLIEPEQSRMSRLRNGIKGI